MTTLTKANEWKALDAIANFGKPIDPLEFAKLLRYRSPNKRNSQVPYTCVSLAVGRLRFLIKRGYIKTYRVNYKQVYWLTELGVNRLFEYDTDPDIKEYLRRLQRGYYSTNLRRGEDDRHS